MARGFIGAVKEMHALLRSQAASPTPAAVQKIVLDTVKLTNTELVRWIRNNPQVLVK